jgi:hypothetical protein
MNGNNLISELCATGRQAPRRTGIESIISPPDEPFILRKLVWSFSDPDDWEILIYKRADLWEACFFLWEMHHEHASGSSFDSVKTRVEERIRILKDKKFKAAVWRE